MRQVLRREKYAVVSMPWRNKYVVVSMPWRDKYAMVSMPWREKYAVVCRGGKVCRGEYAVGPHVHKRARVKMGRQDVTSRSGPAPRWDVKM